MREIKFRAWNKSENRWVNHNEWLDKTPLSTTVVTPSVLTLKPEWDFMQYTGLKDKNGIEIYEGDVVRYTGNSVEHDNYVVSFDYGCFGYFNEWQSFVAFGMDDYVEDGTERKHLQDRHPSFEVIENIYENPDLVGK